MSSGSRVNRTGSPPMARKLADGLENRHQPSRAAVTADKRPQEHPLLLGPGSGRYYRLAVS